ncbi:hypothetical protein [Paenibacillus sp. FSL K6-1230]
MKRNEYEYAGGRKKEKKRMSLKKIGSSHKIEEEDENSQNRNDLIHI